MKYSIKPGNYHGSDARCQMLQQADTFRHFTDLPIPNNDKTVESCLNDKDFLWISKFA